ncbi:MAG: MotA/TolQ/ExbB proton channel family protein [Bdellovibrionota bacterium]
MDLGTIIGLAGGGILVIVVMILSGGIMMYWDLTSIVCVLGGAIFATMIRWPLGTYLNGLIGITSVFFDKSTDPQKLVDDIIELAEVARKQSILALEKVQIEDRFLAKAIRFMVDGYDVDVINEILKVDVYMAKQKAKDGKAILSGMGEAAPAFGMIGTVIGLVVIMANLSDPSKIGPGLAVALITTLYGALIANLVFMPLASKVEYRGSVESTNMAIVVAGVNALLRGQSPRAIGEQLSSYLGGSKDGGEANAA